MRRYYRPRERMQNPRILEPWASLMLWRTFKSVVGSLGSEKKSVAVATGLLFSMAPIALHIGLCIFQSIYLKFKKAIHEHEAI